MRMETPLGRVRGLGSARTGAHHWWLERLTSASTLLLFIWLLVSLLRLSALDYGTVTEWLASPVNSVVMLLLVVSTFWHVKLGMQVIVEDYVHEDGNKLALIILLNFAVVAAAALASVAILKIAFAGAPA